MKIVLGTESVPVGKGQKRRVAEVEHTMVYVPILKTLAVLLNVADEVQYSR